MPYVGSRKTNPPVEDREVLDPKIEALALHVSSLISKNEDLIPVYKDIFMGVAQNLYYSLNRNKWDPSIKAALTMNGAAESAVLAQAIYEVSKKYGYWGAHLGELNYSITRFIQRVPQIMVQEGKWQEKDEFRYWYYGATVSALRYAENHTENLEIGVDGVFEDIKDEYKWKANRAYEAWQIVKSGDCYDTPYYTRLIEVVDGDGKLIGYQDVYLKRSEETVNQDVLDYKLVLQKTSRPKPEDGRLAI